MQIFYTGVLTPETLQKNPHLSLGGYKSSNTVPNGDINNLFPTISKSAIIQNKKEIRMVAIKNNSATSLSSLRIWTESVKFSKVKIAVVEPATLPNGDILFEIVDNSNAIPYQATLESCEGEGQAFSIGDMAAGKVLGLWIQRELDQSKFTDAEKGLPPDLSTLEKADEYIAYLKSQTEENDEIKVILDWV